MWVNPLLLSPSVVSPPPPSQVTLGVLLIAPPMEVWVTWCVLGGLWVMVFAVHEVVFLVCKVARRNKED